MSQIVYYLTDSVHINAIPISEGNLIFCDDTKTIYLDGDGSRVAYESISLFETDTQRDSCINPHIGFYYVKETKMIWRYDNGGWIVVTEPPSTNIVFTPYEELPTQGESEVLYVCGQEIYTWNATKQKYAPINADSIWREI